MTARTAAEKALARYASSAPVHKLEVVAPTVAEARDEAKRVLGPPADHRYWRTWIKRGRDVRLVSREQES